MALEELVLVQLYDRLSRARVAFPVHLLQRVAGLVLAQSDKFL